jgi:hypothetical protein
MNEQRLLKAIGAVIRFAADEVDKLADFEAWEKRTHGDMPDSFVFKDREGGVETFANCLGGYKDFTKSIYFKFDGRLYREQVQDLMRWLKDANAWMEAEEK